MKDPASIIRKILLLLVATAIGIRVNAQSQRVICEKISLESGLSQVNVRCILQDRSGFMWFGTQDGLNRYDGYEFVKFKWSPADTGTIPGNLISCLLEDKSGNIWIGTMGGLAVYNPYTNSIKRIKTKRKGDNILPGNVSSFSLSKNGDIWIGDYQSGFYKYSYGTGKIEQFSVYKEDLKTIADNKVTSIVKDDLGQVWIGTFSSGLFIYHPQKGSFAQIDMPIKSPGANSISALCYFNGTLFIGTLNGFFVLTTDNKKIEAYYHNQKDINSISSNHILSLFCDNDNLWIATENGGLNQLKIREKKFKVFKNDPSDPSSLSENSIYSVYKDRSNILWVGTGSSGINKINLQPVKFNSISRVTHKQGLFRSHSIRAIMIDESKHTWLGTDNGLYELDTANRIINSFFYSPSDKNSLNDNKVWVIRLDHNGNIWVGTQRGLAKYNKKKNNFERYLLPPGNQNEPPVFAIRAIHIDDNNDLWLGTFGAGLFHFSPHNQELTSCFLRIKNPDAVNDIVIFQIHEDSDHNLWLVTTTGLAKFNPATNDYTRHFTGLATDSPSLYRPLYSLYEISRNKFWLGTLGDGLIEWSFNDKTFSSYTESEGLANNVVYAILPDRKGNLWLSTNYGISKFNTDNHSFKNYSVEDGIPGNEFNTGAFFLDKDYTIYFGGTDGVVFFNPEVFAENTRKPQIAITNFKVFDRPVSFNKTYFDQDTIILSYYDNFFSLEFAALDLTAPSKNQYAYMLEGYDTNWVRSGKRRYVAYTNLDPGKYVFRIIASNNDGIWNNEGISIAILIDPPYYMTWWFKTLMAALLVITVGYLYHIRIRTLKSESSAHQRFTKQLIESQEAERYRIASELHDGLGQNLLTIINRSKMALKKSANYSAEQQLLAISETAQESIEEVRRISRDLHPYHLSSIGLTKTIKMSLNNLAEASAFNLIVVTDDIDDLFSPEQELNIFRIIQEGFNNIIKHSGATEAKLMIKKLTGRIDILIWDNGIGMRSDELQAALNSFNGLGLNSISHRVTSLGGKLNINSKENKGFSLHINIPTRQIGD